MVVAYLKTTNWHTYTYVNKLSAHDSDFQWLDDINLLKSVFCTNFLNAVKLKKCSGSAVKLLQQCTILHAKKYLRTSMHDCGIKSLKIVKIMTTCKIISTANSN